MSNKDTENKTSEECGDPCDDCTDYDIRNLTAWTTTQPKSVDNDNEK